MPAQDHANGYWPERGCWHPALFSRGVMTDILRGFVNQGVDLGFGNVLNACRCPVNAVQQPFPSFFSFLPRWSVVSRISLNADSLFLLEGAAQKHLQGVPQVGRQISSLTQCIIRHQPASSITSELALDKYSAPRPEGALTLYK